MPSVAEALRAHAPKYLQTYGPCVPLGHRKVLSYITRCRTGELGHVVYRCRCCQQKHFVLRSCGNRHCPNCQKQKTRVWLERQTSKLLPVQHFVVTFTVPRELRWLLRGNQKEGYNAIFASGSQTIRTLLKNPRYLGSDQVGFFGALHTWGRDPAVYHPHVHFVVPGGGINREGTRWVQTPDNFLFPHARAIALYKKCFAAAMKKCGLYDAVPVEAWRKKWVVNIKPVGNGQAVLKYLAPYIYRVAISDNRIQHVDEKSVIYRVTPSGSKKSISQRVDGNEFVRGFAQHVLPSGFQKIRYYGWMSPNCRMKLERVGWLVWLFKGWTYWLGSDLPQNVIQGDSKALACPHCGGELAFIAIVNQDGRVPMFEDPRKRGPP